MTDTEKKLLKANGLQDIAKEYEINERVRQKYSLSNELAILRQRDTKPEEFAEYNDFVEQIKASVNAEYLSQKEKNGTGSVAKNSEALGGL